MAKGTRPSVIWRFTVHTLLDAYEVRRAKYGPSTASLMFRGAPSRTGDDLIDEALAAFAVFFAERDHYPVPSWAEDPLLGRPARSGKYARDSQDLL